MKPEKAARKRRLPWRRILLLLAVLLLAVAAYFIESCSGWSDLYRAAGVSLDAPDADPLDQPSTAPDDPPPLPCWMWGRGTPF